jgi:molybdate transport system substrate-binding protein
MLAIAVVASGLTGPAGGARAADIVVVSSTAMREAMEAIVPLFENASGHKVRLEFQSGVATNNRIMSGAVADLVVTTGESVDDLIKAGKVAAGSRVDAFRSRVGVAVRAGAPKPDIATAEGFKTAMLGAKTIGYSKGPSGIHLAKVMERLGVADALKTKGKQPELGQRVGDLVARGEADIGVQQINELLPIAGIDYIGPLPGELQTTLVYATGVPTTARQSDAARALVRFVKSETAVPHIRKLGIDPG